MDDSYRASTNGNSAKWKPVYAAKRNERQAKILESAVAKLVAAAGQVGLTVDDLIGLLRCGTSVSDLVDYVVSKTTATLRV